MRDLLEAVIDPSRVISDQYRISPSREGTHSMNHRKQVTCVFPSPSKIPYGGFSPVRLQTEIHPQPSSPLLRLSAAHVPSTAVLISGQEPTRPITAAH